MAILFVLFSFFLSFFVAQDHQNLQSVKTEMGWKESKKITCQLPSSHGCNHKMLSEGLHSSFDKRNLGLSLLWLLWFRSGGSKLLGHEELRLGSGHVPKMSEHAEFWADSLR